MKLFEQKIASSISFKVSLGLIVIVLAAYLVSGVTKHYFDKSALLVETISKKQLPLLITTSKLTKEVAELIWEGSTLVISENVLHFKSIKYYWVLYAIF